LLRHDNVSVGKLGSLDDYLSRLIDNKIWGLKIAKDTFYLRTGDGSFDLLSP
jgi:hypothetical protein